MIGLLMVEDEPAIRQKLVNNVTWASYGFEPVYSAANGLEALAVLETHPEIQIIVTDVQMPQMNGIELIEVMKERAYQSKIVVISGFAEFEYAQKAIKLNVFDYLLKPFASRRLLEVLLRLKNELQVELEQRSELSHLREQLRANRAVLREKLLTDLISGNYLPADLPAQLDFLGLQHFQNRPFQVLALELPESQLGALAEEDKYLLNLQLFNQVKQCFTTAVYPHLLLNYRRNQVVAIVFDPDTKLLSWLEELLNQIWPNLKQSLAGGIGHIYRELTDLAISYQEACSALQYRYLYGLNQVFSIRDLNLDSPSYHKIFFQLHQNPLFDNLKIGADSAIQQDLHHLFLEMQQAQISPELAKIVSSNLVLLAYTTLNESGYHSTDIFGDSSVLPAISRTESINELESMLAHFFEQLNTHIHQRRASFKQKLIHEIQQYLDENYHGEITLSQIAGQYQISPSYLSLLFTEFAGKKFVDYLTERRMKKAQELLKHTELKIYEIANAVGYNDSFYFSNCFKKLLGISPSEYREKVRSQPLS
ncbi:MAG TPA: response regulator [Bacillota bacterium]|nr:response regulator [Bacillota bacterium]